MSEVVTETVAPEAAPAPEPTADDRIAAAVALAAGDEIEEQAPEAQPEAAPEQAPAEAPEEAPAQSPSEYWAKVSEQDREIRQLKAQLKELGEGAEAPSLDSLIADDPQAALDAVLAAMGGDDDEQEPSAATDAVSQRIEALEAKLAEYEAKDAKKAQTAQYSKAKANFENVAGGEEGRWELVKAEGAIELAMATAVEMGKQLGGRYPSIEEALDATEEYLYNEVQGKIERYTKLEKLKGHFATQAPPPQATPPQASVTIEPAAANATASSGLSEEERLAQAIAEMQKQMGA